MDKAVAFLVVAVSGVITASIVYQIVKPGSQGPKVVGVIGTTVTGVTNTLFKG